MFTNVINLVKGGLAFAGGAIVVMGLVSLGQSIPEHNGPGIGQAILKIVGGGLIAGAAIYFGALDTSWANGIG